MRIRIVSFFFPIESDARHSATVSTRHSRAICRLVNRTSQWRDESSKPGAGTGVFLDTDPYVLLLICTFAFPSCVLVSVPCDSPHRFRCDNNRCIYRHELCNHEDDCGDGSDEKKENCKPKSKGRREKEGPPIACSLQNVPQGFQFIL